MRIYGNLLKKLFYTYQNNNLARVSSAISGGYHINRRLLVTTPVAKTDVEM